MIKQKQEDCRHHFEPRYDTTKKDINDDTYHDNTITTTYVYDICVICGKIIKRDGK